MKTMFAACCFAALLLGCNSDDITALYNQTTGFQDSIKTLRGQIDSLKTIGMWSHDKVLANSDRCALPGSPKSQRYFWPGENIKNWQAWEINFSRISYDFAAGKDVVDSTSKQTSPFNLVFVVDSGFVVMCDSSRNANPSGPVEQSRNPFAKTIELLY